MKDRFLIIDGYNMIGQSQDLSQIAQENLEEARSAINRLQIITQL